MRVVMLSPEVYPYAKTGGLADVLAALPPALAAAGVEVTVCVPGYRSALRAAGTPAPGPRLYAPIASRMEAAEMVCVPGAPVPTVLLRADRYFDRDGLYGEGGQDYPDNAERFAFFCRAALEWLRAEREPPDVLHVHEWQAALAPAFLRATAALYPELGRVRTVLTLHNLAFQGRFPADHWHVLNLDARYFVPEFLEFYGEINFLKAGMVFADALTTVSPRYAAEIQTPAFGEGLDGVLRARGAALRGILNGIDDAVWDPATDPHLPARYRAGDLAGKARCKRALQAELGLEVGDDAPLLGVVSRLAEQKGFDLLAVALPPALEAWDAELAVLGSGEERYERWVRELEARFPGRVGAHVGPAASTTAWQSSTPRPAPARASSSPPTRPTPSWPPSSARSAPAATPPAGPAWSPTAWRRTSPGAGPPPSTGRCTRRWSAAGSNSRPLTRPASARARGPRRRGRPPPLRSGE